MDLGLDGNAAPVTAASSGLGLASAEALAREGANVAVCGRSEDHLADAEARPAGRSSRRPTGTGTGPTTCW